MRRWHLVVLLAALVALGILAVSVWGFRAVLAPLALLGAALGAIFGAAGADTQTPEPGRPRRGGVGGSNTEASNPGGPGAEPARRNRPRRGGF